MEGESIESLQEKIKNLVEENKRLKNNSSDYETHDLEDQYKLIKSVPFIFIIIGNDKRIVEANDLANELFKHSIPQSNSSLSGISIEQLFHANTQFQSLLQQALKGKRQVVN